VRWLTLFAAAAATWLPIVGLARLVAQEAPGAVHQAERTTVADPRASAAAASWRAVTLPDDWRETAPGVGEVWYRLPFSAGASEERLAVYLPAVAMNAAVYVNGRLIGTGGRMTEPVARNANRPLLFPIPARALTAGTNELRVRVVADRTGNGFMAAPAVGALDVLEPVERRATFVRRTLLWSVMVFRLVVALFTATIFALWRRERYYGWFALSAVAWVLAELNLVVVDIPVSVIAWTWGTAVAIGWWGIFAVCLVSSFIGLVRPRAERALMCAGVVGSVALAILAASGSALFDPLAVNLWLTVAFGASCYLFRGVLTRLRDHPDAIEVNVVFVVALSVVGLVLWDLLMQLGLRPRGGLTVPPYGAFVAVVGMGWVLLRRFVSALREARALAATLEERVRDETAEVEASYRRILGTERARVLSEERERILRDMDEGLGSQLVSTLVLTEPAAGIEALRPAERAEIQASVRAALDDLRLVIDSLDPIDGELLPALAMLRSRLQPRLDAAGVAVEWRVEDLPPLADLTPHAVLRTLRVVQRAFTDVLARGRGGVVRVRTGTDAGARAAFVEVVDGAAAVVRLVLPLAEYADAGASHVRGIAAGGAGGVGP
jgi:signal transduction histidine kinase